MFYRVEVKLFLVLAITFSYIILLNSLKLQSQPIAFEKIEKSSRSLKIQDVNFHLLERLLYRLDKSLAFFEANYYSVNVDGLFGIRIAEGRF